MSKTVTDQIVSGSRSSYANGRRVNCLTPNNGFVTMRSTWEKIYAEYLKLNHIDFYYEPKPFPLSNGKSYVADFYLPATDEYVEIRGFLSDCQEDKYELFRQEYPHLKWTILYKENLINLGLDLKKDISTIYLLIGAPASGKSWVASQLLDKFEYISYDGTPKKSHLQLLSSSLTSKPKLYDIPFGISTFIKRHSHLFDIRLVAIYEDESTLRNRIQLRGGTWTDTIMKRNLAVKKRFEKYGVNGFIGTSDQCLSFLMGVVFNRNKSLFASEGLLLLLSKLDISTEYCFNLWCEIGAIKEHEEQQRQLEEE